jgi:hypothetical protein
MAMEDAEPVADGPVEAQAAPAADQPAPTGDAPFDWAPNDMEETA